MDRALLTILPVHPHRLILRERYCGLDRSVVNRGVDQTPIRKGLSREQATEGQVAVSGPGTPARALADFGSCSHGHRLGIRIQSHEPGKPVGSSRRQHRLGVDAGSWACVADKASDGGRLQGALTIGQFCTAYSKIAVL